MKASTLALVALLPALMCDPPADGSTANADQGPPNADAAAPSAEGSRPSADAPTSNAEDPSSAERTASNAARSASSLENAPCRCAERTLSDYFEVADEVLVGRLAAVDTLGEPGAPVELSFELFGPAYKSPRAAEVGAGQTAAYRTASTTASCGVQAESGAMYVLFATRQEGTPTPSAWQIDTCSGSRVLASADGTEGTGFQDVPVRFLVGQLNGMAGMAVLDEVVANRPDPTSPANESLVGLLDVSGYSHAGFARLYEAPDLAAGLVAETSSYDELVTREVGYEEPGAVVYALSDGWYKLRLETGAFGWLPPDQAGTYHPYPDVAVNRLNYIESPWHGFVWPSPGAGLPNRAMPVEGQREVPIEVLEMTEVGGFPWLRINVLRASPCEGGDGQVAIAGWIPAFGRAGEPGAWFYSRGC